jgi:Uma2 family endonuclease
VGVVAERRRFTVDEYHKLATAGVLSADDRVELVEGELIQMPPIGSRHAGLVARLDRTFQALASSYCVVWIQNPVSFPPASEPQPDVALLKPRVDGYLGALPTTADVLLVIEVSDSNVAYDRDVRIPLYARQGVTEAWLFDATERRMEIFRDPGPEGYRTLLRPDRDAVVAPLALPTVRVDLTVLFAGIP